jgi:hypothetical protein
VVQKPPLFAVSGTPIWSISAHPPALHSLSARRSTVRDPSNGPLPSASPAIA